MTRFEQITAAFPLHCQRIAELANSDSATGLQWLRDPIDPIFAGASEVLAGAFCWARTTEGGEYWLALYEGARSC